MYRKYLFIIINLKKYSSRDTILLIKGALRVFWKHTESILYTWFAWSTQYIVRKITIGRKVSFCFLFFVASKKTGTLFRN